MDTIWTGTTGASDSCRMAGRPAGETGAWPRLLVIDNDRRCMRLLRRILSQEDHHCLTLQHASNVADVLRAHPTIEVVVSDVVVPDRDGIELIRSIRQQFSDRRWMQFILITGRASIGAAVPVLRAEAVDCLPKPVAPKDLLAAVHHAVLRARAIRIATEGPALQTEPQRPTRRTKEARPLSASPARVPQPAPKPGVEPPVGETTPGQPDPAGALVQHAAYYESLWLLRRLQEARNSLFGNVAPPDPAWEMLTELMLSTLTGEQVAVTSLCLASKAPLTTALRRLDDLIEAGLITRRRDPTDRRRFYVDLSESGLQKMRRYLEIVAASTSETPDETGARQDCAGLDARAGMLEVVAGNDHPGGGQHGSQSLEG